ncbi:MAG TPA: hypothetical protein VH371_05235 [Candidatus Limnocylindrales bacterium]
MLSILLTVTFACGLFIAVAHVLNRRFIAPAYDVAANLTAFGCATAASILVGNLLSAVLSAGAIACWLLLGWRAVRARQAANIRRGPGSFRAARDSEWK